MGTEAIWVPLALAAVSTGAQVYNQNQQAKKQDRILADQIRGNADKQRQADAKTAEMIRREAASTDAGARQSALGQFTDQIQKASGNATRPLQTQGAVSDAYKQAGSDAALGMSNFAGNFADLVSRIDAPQQQRQALDLQRGRYATDIDMLKRFAGGDDYLAQLKLRNVRRNPWLDAASGVAGGFAGAYSGSGTRTPDAYQGWLNNNPIYAGPY